MSEDAKVRKREFDARPESRMKAKERAAPVLRMKKLLSVMRHIEELSSNELTFIAMERCALRGINYTEHEAAFGILIGALCAAES